MDEKSRAREVIARDRDRLLALSHRIHAMPELAFEEERSSAWVAEDLASAGFQVETGVCELPTALIARSGKGPLQIGICAEYDALPDIGHACGHNIIAAAAVGAGRALARIADEIGLTVTVLGTPAEESGGGKILMLERGGFAGLHAAMMVHPAPMNMVQMPCLAVSDLHVHYTGKAAHASAFPEQGINAADALTIAQVGIGLLRQHIRGSERIHGIVTRGGEAPNIVPARTSTRYFVRARTLRELADLEPRVRRCFEAGALATGCQVEVVPQGRPYSEFTHDAEIAGVFRRNAEALGRSFPDLGAFAERTAGSTDMANVSLAMPAIHPMLGIDSLPAVNHQPEFAAHCATEQADNGVLDGAMAMAWTVIDLARDQALRARLMQSRPANA